MRVAHTLKGKENGESIRAIQKALDLGIDWRKK